MARTAAWKVPVVLAAVAAGCARPRAAAPSAAPVVVADERAALPARLRALDPEARGWVERTLAGMSLRQRAAQLVFPWISGASAGDDPADFQRMLDWVRSDSVGGLIVSRGAPGTLAAKLDAAQARAGVPLLVVSDLETGPGMRLSGGTEMAPAMAFGAAGREELAREAGRVTGREARAVGIHLTLGPVLDVNSNPDNPIINVRSFGGDPEAVARLAAAWTRGAREEGLLAAGKHFPGHGDTGVDSHVGLATISGDSARLAAVELVPFGGVVAAGIDGMLVGHIAVAGLEGPGALPASLSPTIVGGLLRRGMGFDGLVFTDAMNMGAITRGYTAGEASVRALLAGADVLLQPEGTASVVDALVEAVASGRVPRERVDEAAQRVLVAKARAGLHRGHRVALDAVAARVATPEHTALAGRVAAASITLVRDRAELVPMRRSVGRVLHVAYGGAGAVLSRELTAGGVQVEHAVVGARTTAREFEALRRRAAEAERVIVSAAVVPVQYRSLGMEGGFAAWVERLAVDHLPVIAVSLGSPYLLRSFPGVPTYLLAWSASEASQRAAAHALLGTAAIEGKLPVAIPPLHEAGEGIGRPRSPD